jgi:hypothetical protein
LFPAITPLGGSRYTGAQRPPLVAFGGPLDFTNGPYFGSMGTFFADVNGDYSADAIVVNSNNVTVRLAQP